jgi:NADH:ubiquinone oxidoreductase subunit 2 (subunit N)
MALRPKAGTGSLGWFIIATFAYCILGLAAAMQLRESDGLRAAAMQLLALALALILLLLCQPRQTLRDAPRQGLASTARIVVWLTLLGIPPTVGFHAKVMLYRSLLSVGWGGMAALAIAVAAAGVLPALSAIGLPPPLPLKGARAAVAVVLIALIVILGLYPQPAISLAGMVQNLAKSG